jgi:hypothetical protein
MSKYVNQFWIDFANDNTKLNEEFRLRDNDRHEFNIPHYHYNNGKSTKFIVSKNIIRDDEGSFAGLDGKPGKFDFN